MPNDNMVARFENWGYSSDFAVFIGMLEMLGGLLVIIPRLSAYGSVLIGTIMIGAVYTHINTGIGSAMFAAIYLLMAIGLGFLRYDQTWKPWRRGM